MLLFNVIVCLKILYRCDAFVTVLVKTTKYQTSTNMHQLEIKQVNKLTLKTIFIKLEILQSLAENVCRLNKFFLSLEFYISRN